jgi:hypothetical protein
MLFEGVFNNFIFNISQQMRDEKDCNNPKKPRRKTDRA